MILQQHERITAETPWNNNRRNVLREVTNTGVVIHLEWPPWVNQARDEHPRAPTVQAAWADNTAEHRQNFLGGDAQDIAPFAIKKACPEVEWWSSLFSPQSESEYLINPASESPLYLILSSFVPLRYQSTYFVYLIYSCIGLLLNHDNLIATNAILGLVSIVA